MKTTDDLRIGPLCVLDVEPRIFSRNEPAIHSLLADLVVAHLETRWFIKRHSDRGVEGVSEPVALWRALRGDGPVIEALPTDRSVAAQDGTRRGSGEFGLQARLAQNLGIGVMLTFVSIMRSYAEAGARTPASIMGRRSERILAAAGVPLADVVHFSDGLVRALSTPMTISSLNRLCVVALAPSPI